MKKPWQSKTIIMGTLLGVYNIFKGYLPEALMNAITPEFVNSLGTILMFIFLRMGDKAIGTK